MKILIIRRDNIGDLVCTTPAIVALREGYPTAEIGALVNSYNSGVLRGNSNVDRVFVYQKLKHVSGFLGRIKALCQRLKLIASLRSWSPDVTILAKSSYDRNGLNFARLIGAKKVIGYVPADLSHAKYLPEIQLPTPEFTKLHEVEAICQLLTPLGLNVTPGRLQIFPCVDSIETFALSLPHASKRIALHISAREAERRWGVHNFIALARYILESKPDTQILLFWSPGNADDPHHPGDDTAAASLIHAIKSDRLIPIITQDLTKLVAALSLCELFIGTDGGAMHLATALNKKVLALFENSSGKLNHWYPWQAHNQVVHSTDAKNSQIFHISQNQVREALDALITGD